MSFLIASREEIGRPQWDEWVDRSDEAWLWHRYNYKEPEHFQIDKTDLSFAVLDANRQPVAVVPLELSEFRFKRFLKLKVLTSVGGPAVMNAVGHKQKAKLYDFLRERLQLLGQQFRVIHIDLFSPPMAPAFRGERCPRVNPLLYLACDNVQTQTWVVDLRLPEVSIRRAYAEGTREELRKIRRTDFQIREARGRADLETYYRLHSATFERTGSRPRPFAYFQHLFDCFVAQGLCRVTFFVQNEEVVAAHNTALYKNAALYWTSASKSGKEHGANRALMDEQILFAKQKGCEWFETGEAFPHLQDGKFKGISDYKKSFGSALYPFFKGQMVIRPRLQAAIQLVKSLRTGRAP
jgi:hypothetical protein